MKLLLCVAFLFPMAASACINVGNPTEVVRDLSRLRPHTNLAERKSLNPSFAANLIDRKNVSPSEAEAVELMLVGEVKEAIPLLLELEKTQPARYTIPA